MSRWRPNLHRSNRYVSSDERGALELAFWRAQLPCPLLDGEHCSNYPVRPFACREHHVTSDPALCL